jgi:hypothetical protein
MIQEDKSITDITIKQNLENYMVQTFSQMSSRLTGFKTGGYTGDGRTDEI